MYAARSFNRAPRRINTEGDPCMNNDDREELYEMIEDIGTAVRLTVLCNKDVPKAAPFGLGRS